jgi:A/G-specific adenine glycosylase
MGKAVIDDAKNQIIVRKKVIQWFEVHGRNFPWRKSNNPYHILIAEMLLRRTTATAVARIYSSFLNRFNTPKHLAQARESTIARAVSSLGLQSVRASQLRKTASRLMKNHAGMVPTAYNDLIALPGVGAYTASAVRNFAFGEPEPLVDGNIIHFLSRVFTVTYRGPTDSNAWEFMTHFGGKEQDAKLYWGIIDLVATLCLRRAPRCPTCPLSEICASSI